MTKNRFLLEEQLTIVSTKTLHELFQMEHGNEAIALYMFYYYTAKWQKTNQPKATESYCRKGLGWGKTRFRRAKKNLEKVGLIETVRAKNSEGEFTGYYIKLKYLWKKETIKKIGEDRESHHTSENPPGGKTHRVEKQPSNALSDNKENASSVNNKKTTEPDGSGIQKIDSVLKDYKPKNTDKKGGGAKYQWQDMAVRWWEKLHLDGEPNGSWFRIFKLNSTIAERACSWASDSGADNLEKLIYWAFSQLRKHGEIRYEDDT